MAQLRKGTTYATGDQITATNINALVDNAILLSGAINDQTSGSVQQTDNLLLAGTSDLKKATVSSLLTGLVKADGTVSMTADLPLANSTPAVALSAASKGYVDTTVTSSVASAIPTGAIMSFYRSTAPAGWLECNGQSTTGYAALAALIGATVPDLRGEFIRGWANNRTGIPDAGRALGSFEDEAFKSHTHTASSAAHSHAATDSGHSHGFTGAAHSHSVNDPGHTHQTGNDNNNQNGYGHGLGGDGSNPSTQNVSTSYTGISINSATAGGTVGSGSANISVSSTAASVTIDATGGTETRPRNVAFMYCIKT